MFDVIYSYDKAIEAYIEEKNDEFECSNSDYEN